MDLTFPGVGGGEAEALRGERRVHFPGFGTHPTAVYDRLALRPGQRFDGPAVVEERESTTVLDPGAKVEVDSGLNLIITLI
jgi:N-methylhydantoinase A